MSSKSSSDIEQSAVAPKYGHKYNIILTDLHIKEQCDFVYKEVTIANLRSLFSRRTESRSAGLGSVLDCVCFKYYGVSTEEISA